MFRRHSNVSARHSAPLPDPAHHPRLSGSRRQGARRFHNWLPFAPALYDAFGPRGAATPSTATATGTADSYYSDARQGQQGGERALWAVDQPSPASDPNSYYSGHETYDYPGSEYYGYTPTTTGSDSAYQQDWQGDQQAGWVQNWSPEANQQWYDPNQSPSQLSSADYCGAESYDGAAASDYYYPEWTPDTPVTPKWAVTGVGETSQEWSSSGPDTAGYYGYGAAGGAESMGPNIANMGWDEGWATPEIAEAPAASTSAPAASTSGNGDFSASSIFAGGGDGGGGGARGADTADVSSAGGNNTTETPPSGGSSGRPWSVNEFGQRVAGDWVEYYDESAQAAYFYNTASGEASHAKWEEAWKSSRQNEGELLSSLL